MLYWLHIYLLVLYLFGKFDKANKSFVLQYKNFISVLNLYNIKNNNFLQIKLLIGIFIEIWK